MIDFDKKPLSTEYILERVSERDIYEYYLGSRIKTNDLIKCCFHDDRSPSLGFYGDPLKFKCFGCGKQGSVFTFVKELNNLDFKSTLELINKDFKLDGRIFTSSRSNNFSDIDHNRFSSNTSEAIRLKTQIIPTYQAFTKIDYDYWNQYYIPLELLLEYDIKACKLVYIVKKSGEYILWGEYHKNNPIYSYLIDDSYKIYRPLNPTKNGKWISNTTNYDIQGLAQLPSKGELLIITSSLKDVLVLKVLGYNAIALGGEGNRIPDKILDYLYACFDNIIVFYDNDKAGLQYGEKLARDIGTSFIYVPTEYKSTKDISDFIQEYKWEKTIALMNKLI